MKVAYVIKEAFRYERKICFMNRNKLTIKDLVSIGVFAVIYFICMFAVGMIGVVTILYLVYPAA